MKTNTMTDELFEYVAKHCPLPHPILADLAKETSELPNAAMQISPDQGSFMNFVARLIGAQNIIEVGCFTGYSAICMAAALPHDGKLVTLDASVEYTDMARKYFGLANLTAKIEVIIGDAKDNITKVKEQTGIDQFDMAFIDADKTGMATYYEECLKLVRKGGLIVCDNVLWGGSVVDQAKNDEDTAAIRAFNEKVRSDPRVEHTMLHISDGLLLCRT